ncbi:hypothetical protein U1Q18_051915, partial [Sarracenia purpurea var. burkii]
KKSCVVDLHSSDTLGVFNGDSQNQMSIQTMWKKWLHLGRRRIRSLSRSPDKQTM